MRSGGGVDERPFWKGEREKDAEEKRWRGCVK